MSFASAACQAEAGGALAVLGAGAMGGRPHQERGPAGFVTKPARAPHSAIAGCAGLRENPPDSVPP